MLKSFRMISLIEGLSLVALVCIAMPAKYMFNNPSLVPYVGMTHGVLWLIYLVMSLSASHNAKWSVGYWLFTLVLSVVPFGFIVLELQLKKSITAQEGSESPELT
ncbi:DUF3817 domain-containing protein [Litoribacillus peritrichatus]|uniref:DUF3817 domain-containing protein n=1 Tax=Litoribacillus peritrichatus TaxID=718191 RepID=A0ABP7N2H8_9GAMM